MCVYRTKNGHQLSKVSNQVIENLFRMELEVHVKHGFLQKLEWKIIDRRLDLPWLF